MLPATEFQPSHSMEEKEIVMPNSAAKKKANLETVSSMSMGRWGLTVTHDPNVGMLDSIEITAQVRAGGRDLIFGNVRTLPPVTAYALEHGEVTPGSGIPGRVYFKLQIEGIVYTFTGTLDQEGKQVTGGSITPPLNPKSEPGTWTAQAQGGGSEENERARHRPARRTLR